MQSLVLLEGAADTVSVLGALEAQTASASRLG